MVFKKKFGLLNYILLGEAFIAIGVSSILGINQIFKDKIEYKSNQIKIPSYFNIPNSISVSHYAKEVDGIYVINSVDSTKVDGKKTNLESISKE